MTDPPRGGAARPRGPVPAGVRTPMLAFPRPLLGRTALNPSKPAPLAAPGKFQRAEPRAEPAGRCFGVGVPASHAIFLSHRTPRITLKTHPSRRRRRSPSGRKSPSGWDRNLSRLAALADPTRRDLYYYVARQPGPVSREQAARALGISRPLAAFHLDKLLAAGLLEAEFRRLTGRQGPGAGRPAKLYRRSQAELAISLPERRYELAASLLAQAIQRARALKSSPVQAAEEAARAFGLSLGKQAREQAGPRAGRARLLARAEEVLKAHGFEPLHQPKGWIRLRNCPFDAVAREHRQLICGMNLALMKGLMRGLGLGERQAVLEPQPDGCCVILRATPAA